MKAHFILCCLLATIAVSSSKSLDSRNVVQFADSDGGVSLLEFTVRGVLYGHCTYVRDDGAEVSVMFEDSGEDLKARTTVPGLVDPVTEARQCRHAATVVPESESNYRSDIDKKESDDELKARFSAIQRRLATGQQYISHLQPRFIKFTKIAADTTTDTKTTTFSITKPVKKPFFSGIRIETLNIPIPVVVKEFNIPVIVPKLETVKVEKHFIG